MRIYILYLLLFCASSAMGQNKTIYDFSALTIDGDTLHFSSLAGKKILVVNTASECMFTPQYEKLQELYEEYGGDDFEIIAFPCNDFGKQEPGDNASIKEFCQQYPISFTLMQKITIKGDDVPPVYRWLTDSKENGTLDAKVKWNFQKFMIDETGSVVDFVGPAISPLSNKIKEWLEE
ncbi:glutathione peroxidase [Draconibacterium sp. IB214405]|uniref:glutathione peroxidase n=1 Tax=Draconibacterium sp. IB214405 TaxID=3097352 RepID=UPI002A104545|nr:glutathione peroxidase [Draconibacterium sp. IB214405]MDX8339157.1 glutathione peroxidase [Draconibacterium sp. IB214405]